MKSDYRHKVKTLEELATLMAEKNIHTLPVIIGEKPARYMLVAMLILQYILTIALVISGYYTLAMAAVVLAIPTLAWRSLLWLFNLGFDLDGAFFGAGGPGLQ